MTTLYDRNIIKLHELVPEAHWAAELWHADCVTYGRPFTVSEAYRTTERQKQLYAQGRTKPGAIVTERDGVKNKSDHQLRTAADIYPNCPRHLQAEWWADIEEIGRKYNITHPYTKGRFIDLPHFTFDKAKKRPEPKLPRIPASLNEAIRKIQRQIKSTKPGLQLKRLENRLKELLLRK